MSGDYDERDEFNIKLAEEVINRISPLLIHELGRLPYTAQWLVMGNLVGDWLSTLGDKRDDALDTVHSYAGGSYKAQP